jgi:hypothetical protein
VNLVAVITLLRMRRAWIALLLASRVATAQPVDLTKEFQAGVDAFRLGKLDEARAHLEKARSLDPKLPGPHRFLAAVAHAQTRWDDCIESGHKALEINPASSEAADTRKLYESCRVAAGRSPARQDLGDSAAIAVVTNVPGASVKINGLTYGGTPLAPRPITPGTLDIEIDKPGWKPIKRTVNAIAGVITDVNVDLEPDKSTEASNELEVKAAAKLKNGYLVLPTGSGMLQINDAPPPPLTNERYELPAGTHVVELQQPGKDPWRRRVRITAGQKTTLAPMFVDTESRTRIEKRGMLVAGAGGVVLAGGFAAAMLSRNAASEARDIVRTERSRDASRPLSETDDVAPVRTRDDLHDARDRSARWAVISNALYVTGLVTAGVGAYFIYQGARERRDAPPPFAIAPVQGGAVIAKELAW